MKTKSISKKISLFFLIIISTFSGAFFLLSGNQSEQTSPAWSESVPGFWSLVFKTIILLGFIIVLIYALLFLLRKFVYHKNFKKTNNSIQVLEYMPLVAKKSLCVVKVIDKILVLGISESNINKLAEVNDPEQQKKWLEALSLKSAKKTGSFAEQLQNILGHKKN